jgi:hypothetical protein
MKTLQIKSLIGFSGFALAVSLSAASAQAPAIEPKGPVAKPLLNLDLAPEMDSVQRVASCACN